jgi:hypothetical protein
MDRTQNEDTGYFNRVEDHTQHFLPRLKQYTSEHGWTDTKTGIPSWQSNDNMKYYQEYANGYIDGLGRRGRHASTLKEDRHTGT